MAADLITAEILAERRRQMEQEGWSAEHDDLHACGELALAAASYASHSAAFRDAAELDSAYAIRAAPPSWPWTLRWWRPRNPRRDLIHAAALIVAEIERLDRAAAAEATRKAAAVCGFLLLCHATPAVALPFGAGIANAIEGMVDGFTGTMPDRADEANVDYMNHRRNGMDAYLADRDRQRDEAARGTPIGGDPGNVYGDGPGRGYSTGRDD